MLFFAEQVAERCKATAKSADSRLNASVAAARFEDDIRDIDIHTMKEYRARGFVPELLSRPVARRKAKPRHR